MRIHSLSLRERVGRERKKERERVRATASEYTSILYVYRKISQ